MFALSRQVITSSSVACLCLVAVSLLQFPRMQKLLSDKSYTEVVTLEREIKAVEVRLKFLKKIPTFGYDNLIANWIYLNFLQYFGDDEVRAKTGYGLSPQYFEVILKRDPRFVNAYLALSTSGSMYAGMPQESVKIMNEGLKSLSPWVPKNSYYIWRYKGVDELLFLGDTKAARKSFKNAAQWAKEHFDTESQQVASISAQTAEFLKNNRNSKYAQISAWAMVLSNGADQKTEIKAIREIEALGGKVVSTPQGNKIQFPQKD
ncbi:hypothetical protein [Rivularia sp. UHCC 0363]|uniref:hypothetical protein n=1 Tax=Rivularia sp. UHCC 0363 TaxID=3110244 RepID=UPI002B21FF94|nr:hypothetical protein [Rivularia sp. UHCC 0363]MEA5592779.1 hypothetical protein [Rivularia sp. UHCC 0363]